MYHDFSRCGHARVRERGRMPDRQRHEMVDPIAAPATPSPTPPPHPSRDRRVRPLDAEMVEDRGEVDREERDRVRLDLGGLVARAVAALVVGDHLEPGVDERGHLLRPQPLGVGEAVHEHDRPALAFHLTSRATPLESTFMAIPLRVDRSRGAPRDSGPGSGSSRQPLPELDDPLEHARPGEHLVGRRRCTPAISRKARSTSGSLPRRGLQRHRHLVLGLRARTRVPSISAWISARRRRSNESVPRYHGSTVAIVASYQPRASSTGSAGASCSRSRSATAWITPMLMPRPTDGFVHAHESASASTPVATGLPVDHERAVPVLDLRHDRDALVERLAVEPVRDERVALDARASTCRRPSARAARRPWR